MSQHVTNAELKRIADALEKIAAVLTTPTVQVQQQTYEPAPYWQNPNWKAPEMK